MIGWFFGIFLGDAIKKIKKISKYYFRLKLTFLEKQFLNLNLNLNIEFFLQKCWFFSLWRFLYSLWRRLWLRPNLELIYEWKRFWLVSWTYWFLVWMASFWLILKPAFYRGCFRFRFCQHRRHRRAMTSNFFCWAAILKIGGKIGCHREDQLYLWWRC